MEDRANAAQQAREKAVEKAAEAASDNAKLAADLKHELLLRLTYIARKYPKDATEVRAQKSGSGSVIVYKLTDLTRALRDLTEDAPSGAADVEDLKPLAELLKDE